MDSIITFLNTAGKSFVVFSSSMLIQSSVLIILLLLLDAFLRKKVRVVFLYGIWMLVLVKLVLPTTFSLPTGIGNWFGDKAPGFITEAVSIPEKIASFILRIKPVSKTVPSGIEIFIRPLTGISPGPIAETSPEFTVEASPATASLSWQGFTFLGWLTAVTAMLLLLIRRMFLVRGLLAKSGKPSESMVNTLKRCRKEMGVHRPILLRISRVAAGPSVCGLFRPTILIPQSLLHRLKREDLRTILLHELAHIKRGDLWISLIQTILQIVYFYNPLLWVANVIIRKVREQAVDEMVLVAMGEKAEDYPQTLLNVSRMTFSRPALNLRLIGVSESKKALERRIMNMLNRPVPKSSKLGYLGLMAIVVIGAVMLPMHYDEQNALAASVEDGRNAGGIIVPGIRVGEYTFDMTEDDVLEKLGEPKAIFYGDQKYTLDNLPRKYFMHYGDVSFHIVNDSVKGITALSPSYKFDNGVRVGDSEQKIKEAFGGDFNIKETKWKDFLYYRDKGLMFEINKQDRTVMEINVSPIKSSKPYKKAPGAGKIIIPGLRVGKYTFDMSKEDVLDSLGKPNVIFYGEKRYTLDDLPEKYYMPYEDVSFLIVDDSVKEITVLSPSYKLPNGVRVGDSERKIKNAFGDDFRIKEGKRKDFLSYRDKGLTFEIHKQDRTVMEINVSPVPGSEFYKKAHIPSTSYINEQGRIVDKIDWPFVNDPRLMGTWKSVDFVREMEQFKAGEKQWKGDLYLKELIFMPDGKTFKPWWTWTKGLVFHLGSKTASKYTLKDIEGSTYMFFEWKSGDYTIRYMKPFYYVLKKVSDTPSEETE
jgi:beta-lactamase regulating signal transducer with metallopeptidase domain